MNIFLFAFLLGCGAAARAASTPLVSTAPAAPDPFPPAVAEPAASPPLDVFLSDAEVALVQGELDKARRRVMAYIEDHKKSPEAWTLYGRIELEDKRYKRANKYFSRALKYSPQHAPAFFGKGQAEERRGRLDEAANEYRAATLADPGHAAAKAALERLGSHTNQPVVGAF